MAVREIASNIYSVGVVDWNARHFHGHTYSTKRGTSYNAYLILDEKVTLIDTVHGAFTAEFLDNIKKIVPLEKIDLIIANHVEVDHSGALPELLTRCPKAKVVGDARCQAGLEKYYHRQWDFRVVKTGDKLSIGKRTLAFIEVPMIHWPDSMLTYLVEDGILFSNDAFGQHYASSERFDDEVDNHVLMEEAGKYFANILWPFSHLIAEKLLEIEKLGISVKMIATAHGISWRKDPGQILGAYKRWAANETKPRIVVAYETMWGSTEKMARKIVEGIVDAGVSVRLYDIAQTDRTEVIYDMFEAKGYLFGTSNHDSGVLPNMASFIEFVKGLKPKNRIGGIFGSYGWSGVSIKLMETFLKNAGIEQTVPSLAIQYAPDPSGLDQCYEFGKQFAALVKNS